jgi:hypothetical protein
MEVGLQEAAQARPIGNRANKQRIGHIFVERRRMESFSSADLKAQPR